MRTRAPRALLTSFMQHMLPKIDCGEILGDLGFVKGYLAGKWAIVLAFMICTMHYALTASTTAISDEAVALPTYVIPAKMLGFAVVGAVLLVMGSGFSTYIIDLRSSTELADRIHQLSFNDSMTELPNRISFNERLSFDAAEAHEKAHKLATFSINIDGFKDVNDVFGHSAADLLLIEVADRMRRILGRGEFLARQSGDEFLGCRSPAIIHRMPRTLLSVTGVIIPIGEWALRTACRAAAEGRLPGTVAVNLSTRHPWRTSSPLWSDLGFRYRYRTRTEGPSGARKTTMIVALARKLLIALWRPGHDRRAAYRHDNATGA